MARVASPHFVSSVLFADRAGVALVSDVDGRYSVLDIGTGEVIATGQGPTPESLSPNGRVFAVFDGYATELRETETGVALLRLPGVHSHEVFWIGDVGMVHTVPDEAGHLRRHLVFREFASGRESKLDVRMGGADGVMPIPGTTDRFAVTSGKGFHEMVVERTADRWAARIESDSEWAGRHSRDFRNLSSDRRFVLSARGTELVVMDLATGAEHTETFAGFNVSTHDATPDPDLVLLRGFHRDRPGKVTDGFLYSLSRRTLAVVPAERLPQRSLFVHSMGVNVAIEDKDIFPVSIEATTAPGDLGTVLAANRRSLDTVSTAQKPEPQQPARTAEQIAVAELAKSARIVGVGVYEGSSPTRAHPGGFVRVQVLRTRQPILLVLAAYDNVQWVVSVEPGADVRAILLSGYKPAAVIGTSLPVHRIGEVYAYEAQGSHRMDLDDAVKHWTGKNLDSFHGKYQGDGFVLIE